MSQGLIVIHNLCIKMQLLLSKEIKVPILKLLLKKYSEEGTDRCQSTPVQKKNY